MPRLTTRFFDVMENEPRVRIHPAAPNPFAGVRTRVGSLRALSPTEAEEPDLVWEVGQIRFSPPLDDLVWTFLQLADADPARIAAFAATFGPLGAAPIARNDGAAESRLYAEPLAAWRALARGLAAVIDVAADLQHGYLGEPARATMVRSVAVPLWLQNRDPADPFPNDKALESLVMALELSETLGTRDAQVDLLDRLLAALLRSAGVEAAFSVDEADGLGPAYAIPALGGKPFAGDSSGLQFVDGLLPILASQTVLAFGLSQRYRSVPIHRCSWCGRPYQLEPGMRKPRRGLPHYGTHEECRRQAQLESKRVTAKRAYERRKATQAAARTEEGAGPGLEDGVRKPE